MDTEMMKTAEERYSNIDLPTVSKSSSGNNSAE